MWVRFLPYLLALAGAATILTGAYVKGRLDCKTSEQVKQLEAYVETEKNHEKITQEVIRLPASKLRSRYCEWVRDDKDKCLQANIPIP